MVSYITTNVVSTASNVVDAAQVKDSRISSLFAGAMAMGKTAAANTAGFISNNVVIIGAGVGLIALIALAIIGVKMYQAKQAEAAARQEANVFMNQMGLFVGTEETEAAKKALAKALAEEAVSAVEAARQAETATLSNRAIAIISGAKGTIVNIWNAANEFATDPMGLNLEEILF